MRELPPSVLEPLREEALTDVDSEREAMDPAHPTACGTTAERSYRHCHVIGTWDNFRDLHEMTWEGGEYRCCVMLGENAEESFQIVVDGLRTRQIYPRGQPTCGTLLARTGRWWQRCVLDSRSQREGCRGA